MSKRCTKCGYNDDAADLTTCPSCGTAWPEAVAPVQPQPAMVAPTVPTTPPIAPPSIIPLGGSTSV